MSVYYLLTNSIVAAKKTKLRNAEMRPHLLLNNLSRVTLTVIGAQWIIIWRFYLAKSTAQI